MLLSKIACHGGSFSAFKASVSDSLHRQCKYDERLRVIDTLHDIVTARLSHHEPLALHSRPRGCFAVRQAGICNEPALENCARYVAPTYIIPSNANRITARRSFSSCDVLLAFGFMRTISRYKR